MKAENLKNVVRFSNQSCPAAAELVNGDVSYSVLTQILKRTCTDVYTNGKSLIICYSNAPYPVWVWCKAPFDKADVQTVANILTDEYMSKGKFNFIICEELLDELKKTNGAFSSLTPKMELLSYELRQINEIDNKCDGYIRKACLEDLDVLASMIKDACFEMENLSFSLDECKKKAINFIEDDNFYVWCNGLNEIVALTNAGIDGKYAKIAMVFTATNFRRKGYAINLVHSVTKILLQNNLLPILYTDGGYTASNECYKKIGYKQVGSLKNLGN